MKYRTRYLLLSIPLLMLLAGCVDFEILNNSDANVRVMIQTPDSDSAYTRLIAPGETASSFSSYGGSYTITTLPDTEYKQMLEKLRVEISTRLFEEAASLTADEVARLVSNLNEVDEAVNQMANDGDSCSGTAPDFSAVTAVVNWSVEQDKWAISCGVAQSDTE